MDEKKQLILDIQRLLNSYEGGSITHINPALLEYMSVDELKKIIEDLLIQKEKTVDENSMWLEQFKKHNN